MSKDKLGLFMSEYDKRVEELENTLKWVMYFVDKYLEGDEFENCEMERAVIMHRKVTNLLAAKDKRIDELEELVKEIDGKLEHAYQYICKLKEDHY